LVLKSSLAVGERSFLRKNRARQIEALVFRLGRESGVRVYRYANSGNHLHLLLRPSSRQAFKLYVRALSGLIARMVLGAERGSAQGLKFWDARPFSRIVEWGRDFKNLGFYILQNTLEATGFMPHQPRISRAKMIHTRQ
jgi:REP element-mobilizing transposase RayT